jgi:hypothetical protein
MQRTVIEPGGGFHLRVLQVMLTELNYARKHERVCPGGICKSGLRAHYNLESSRK